MNLKEKIQNDKAIAMKNGNKELNVLLGTVIGECDRVTKNPTDEEVIRIIKKMIESSLLCGIENESKLLEIYLPQMMTEKELNIAIFEHCAKMNISEKKDLKYIMTFLKTTFPSKYDGKLASQIAMKILK